MNTVVANSIVIACMSSIGAFVIKLMQGYVPLGNAIFLIVGSVICAHRFESWSPVTKYHSEGNYQYSYCSCDYRINFLSNNHFFMGDCLFILVK